MKTKINTLFQNLNTFRLLPSYQLERRADIFFSLYIAEALSAKTGEKIKTNFIPEFPVRKGTINQDEIDNRSVKIDYVCFSEDLKKAYFVELKTDPKSRRPEQDDYLKKAKKAGIQKLIKGVLKIFRATNAKRKYYALLELMEKIGLFSVPKEVKDITKKESWVGITEASNKIEIICNIEECHIIYLQPGKSGKNIINFEEFSKTVSKYRDEISKRFVKSLREWGTKNN